MFGNGTTNVMVTMMSIVWRVSNTNIKITIAMVNAGVQTSIEGVIVKRTASRCVNINTALMKPHSADPWQIRRFQGVLRDICRFATALALQ